MKGKEYTNERRTHFEGDKGTVLITIILTMISFLMIPSANERWLTHAIYIALAYGAMFLFYKIDYRSLSALSTLALIVAFAILLLTLLTGDKNSRTITFLNIDLQTFYLIGFLVIFFISKFLAVRMSRGEELTNRDVIKLLVIIPVFCAGIFTANQSTAIILLGTCLVVLFLGRVKIKYLLLFTTVILFCGTIMIASGLFRSSTFNNRVEYWRTGKVTDGNKDYGIQIIKAKAAISRAQWFPTKVGKGVVKAELPEKDTDYVYTVLVEELGILIGFFVLFLYLMLLYRAARIARNAEGPFGAILAFGIGFWICSQALVHIAVNCDLIPSTGQTLPFISRGGASLLISGAAVGMLLNISKNRMMK